MLAQFDVFVLPWDVFTLFRNRAVESLNDCFDGRCARLRGSFSLRDLAHHVWPFLNALYNLLELTVQRFGSSDNLFHGRDCGGVRVQKKVVLDALLDDDLLR